MYHHRWGYVNFDHAFKNLIFEFLSDFDGEPWIRDLFVCDRSVVKRPSAFPVLRLPDHNPSQGGTLGKSLWKRHSLLQMFNSIIQPSLA